MRVTFLRGGVIGYHSRRGLTAARAQVAQEEQPQVGLTHADDWGTIASLTPSAWVYATCCQSQDHSQW